MALRREEADAWPGFEDQPWTLSWLYAACDPAGWDACALRGEPWPLVLYVLPSTVWSDFDKRKWSAWDKWLRRYSLGFMRHPSAHDRNAARRFQWGTRGGWVTGDIGIVEPVQAACEMAGLTARQTEAWMLSEGDQLPQRGVALALHISQPMVKRHLANARSRLAQEWGVITPGLEVEGTRGCAWRYRGFLCRVRCQQLQNYQEVAG